jgi:hypothetical protein
MCFYQETNIQFEHFLLRFVLFLRETNITTPNEITTGFEQTAVTLLDFYFGDNALCQHVCTVLCAEGASWRTCEGALLSVY